MAAAEICCANSPKSRTLGLWRVASTYLRFSHCPRVGVGAASAWSCGGARQSCVIGRSRVGLDLCRALGLLMNQAELSAFLNTLSDGVVGPQRQLASNGELLCPIATLSAASGLFLPGVARHMIELARPELLLSLADWLYAFAPDPLSTHPDFCTLYEGLIDAAIILSLQGGRSKKWRAHFVKGEEMCVDKKMEFRTKIDRGMEAVTNFNKEFPSGMTDALLMNLVAGNRIGEAIAAAHVDEEDEDVAGKAVATLTAALNQLLSSNGLMGEKLGAAVGLAKTKAGPSASDSAASAAGAKRKLELARVPAAPAAAAPAAAASASKWKQPQVLDNVSGPAAAASAPASVASGASPAHKAPRRDGPVGGEKAGEGDAMDVEGGNAAPAAAAPPPPPVIPAVKTEAPAPAAPPSAATAPSPADLDKDPARADEVVAAGPSGDSGIGVSGGSRLGLLVASATLLHKGGVTKRGAQLDGVEMTVHQLSSFNAYWSKAKKEDPHAAELNKRPGEEVVLVLYTNGRLIGFSRPRPTAGGDASENGSVALKPLVTSGTSAHPLKNAMGSQGAEDKALLPSVTRLRMKRGLFVITGGTVAVHSFALDYLKDKNGYNNENPNDEYFKYNKLLPEDAKEKTQAVTLHPRDNNLIALALYDGSVLIKSLNLEDRHQVLGSKTSVAEDHSTPIPHLFFTNTGEHFVLCKSIDHTAQGRADSVLPLNLVCAEECALAKLALSFCGGG